jgi:transcriptional regulator with XRE-family HTH domain
MPASTQSDAQQGFSAWIRVTRARHGWSQAACARKAGRTPQQWHSLETRTVKPHLETVALIARVLEAPTSEAMAAAGYGRESGADAPPEKAQAISRALEALKRLDLAEVEEVADYIAFKLARKRSVEKGASQNITA